VRTYFLSGPCCHCLLFARSGDQSPRQPFSNVVASSLSPYAESWRKFLWACSRLSVLCSFYCTRLPFLQRQSKFPRFFRRLLLEALPRVPPDGLRSKAAPPTAGKHFSTSHEGLFSLHLSFLSPPRGGLCQGSGADPGRVGLFSSPESLTPIFFLQCTGKRSFPASFFVRELWMGSLEHQDLQSS